MDRPTSLILFFTVAAFSAGLIVAYNCSMSCPWRGQEDLLVSLPPTFAKTWRCQGWDLTPWRVKYPIDHAVASTGAAER